MKKIFFICLCKEKYNLFSSYKKDINLNICSNCHPFYTKKKFLLNSSKRTKNFNLKYENFFKK